MTIGLGMFDRRMLILVDIDKLMSSAEMALLDTGTAQLNSVKSQT